VILHCAETPVREMFAAGSAKAHSVEGAFIPRLVDWLMEATFFDKQKSHRPARHAEEALDAPSTGLRQRSGTRNDVKESSLYTRASMHPLLTGAIVMGAGLGALVLLGGISSKGRRAWPVRPSRSGDGVPVTSG